MKRHVLRNLKKVLATVLAVAMVVTYIPEAAFTAQAEGEGTVAEAAVQAPEAEPAQVSVAEDTEGLHADNLQVANGTQPFVFGFNEHGLLDRIDPSDFYAEGIRFSSESNNKIYFSVMPFSGDTVVPVYLRVPKKENIPVTVVTPTNTNTWIKSISIASEAVDFTTIYAPGAFYNPGNGSETVSVNYTAYQLNLTIDHRLNNEDGSNLFQSIDI